MKAHVDADLCSGCGLCTDSVPDVFVMTDDNVAKVVVDPAPANLEGDVQTAADDCPSAAIIIE